MNITTKRMERLIQALEAGLSETQDKNSPLAVAIWTEANSEGGYIIHRDGRMMQAGDYQHGFTHIDQLKAGLSSENNEIAKWARHEIGMIATCMQPYDGNIKEDQLWYNIISSFSRVAEKVNSRTSESTMVLNAINEGMTLEQVIDLYCGRPGSLRVGGVNGLRQDVVLKSDLTTALLTRDDDGSLRWLTETLARKGDTLSASNEMSNPNCRIIVSVDSPKYGQIGLVLKDGEYEIIPDTAPKSSGQGLRP